MDVRKADFGRRVEVGGQWADGGWKWVDSVQMVGGSGRIVGGWWVEVGG